MSSNNQKLDLSADRKAVKDGIDRLCANDPHPANTSAISSITSFFDVVAIDEDRDILAEIESEELRERAARDMRRSEAERDEDSR